MLDVTWVGSDGNFIRGGIARILPFQHLIHLEVKGRGEALEILLEDDS